MLLLSAISANSEVLRKKFTTPLWKYVVILDKYVVGLCQIQLLKWPFSAFLQKTVRSDRGECLKRGGLTNYVGLIGLQVGIKPGVLHSWLVA